MSEPTMIRKLSRTGLCALLAGVTALGMSGAAVADVDLNAVLRAVQKQASAEAATNAKREAAFKAELARQQKLLGEAMQTRNAAEALSNSLSQRFDANQVRADELEQLLKEHQGNLGELFGVTRQVAGDAASALQQSLISAQYSAPAGEEDRVSFLRRLATAKALPSIGELERLWFELQREMTATAEVARFKAPVLKPGQVAPTATDDATATAAPPVTEIVRIGPFTAASAVGYLGYLPTSRALLELPSQPGAALRELAEGLAAATSGYVPAAVDPSRGALLAMYVERPDWLARIHQGGFVGYVIIGVGALGALLWAGQLIYLLLQQMAVRRQRRQAAQPSPGNPLGRVLLAANPADAANVDPAMAELRISEAVLREVPRLERFQGVLRLAVAAGPLLGLIGTVIGMIITFQSITATGASDPKLMADGIGQAMIATVLGLGVAIPLLFANTVLSALSRSLVQILDEQSEALLADMLGRRG